MDRSAKHILEDLDLRESFVAQESLDEFALRVGSQSSADETVGMVWQSTLHPETTINEILYLQGITSLLARTAIMEQQVAVLREHAIKAGKMQPSEQDRKFEEMFLDWHS